MMNDSCYVYVRDKETNRIHRVGTDQHDSFWVDMNGTLHYSNMQNGDGCSKDSILDENQGYEFCPMDYGTIDKEYLLLHGLEGYNYD